MTELWEAPDEVARATSRGDRGARSTHPGPTFTFDHMKTKGVSPGMTVRDPEGREWSVKQEPDEGKVEVTS